MTTTLDIDKKDLERFSYFINYDLATFLDLYRMFVENNLPNIVSYFSEANTAPDVYSFNFLKRLKAESIIIDNLIKTNLSLMFNMADWEMLDFFEDLKIKLDTYSNMSKWTRSNKTTTGWQQTSVQSNYTLGVYETLEDVEDKLFDSENPQDDWQKIAMDNNLTELEYTTQGGNILKINKDISFNPELFLQSIIDNLIGEKMYGLDFDKKIQFVDNDLKILPYKETVIQSFNILITLKKGDIPEFKSMGMNLMIGGNVATFYYVSLVKQLQASFDTDDSFRNFLVSNISYLNGDIYVTGSADTFYNLTIAKDAKI